MSVLSGLLHPFDPGLGILLDIVAEDDILSAFEEDSWFRDVHDRIEFQFDNMVYWFRRGYLAQAIIQAWDTVYQWSLDQFKTHPFRSVFALAVPLSLAASAMMYLRNRRRKRYALTWQIRRLARIMRSLQLAVWRKTGVQREPWQTYGAWARELNDPSLNECVALYERIRYAGRQPLPEDVEAFERTVRAVRRRMPPKKS